MTANRRLVTASVKEFREVAPVALCGLAIVGALGIGVPPMVWLDYAIFCTLAVVLGAMSFGHEYRHRTIGMLLAQPGPRLVTLAVKLGVLVVLLGVLVVASRLTVDGRVLIPLTCAVFLAPWLTMVLRSEIGGAVFATAIPAALFAVARVTALLASGAEAEHPDDGAALMSRILWIGMVAAAGCGAAGTVWTFLRLQVIEGERAEMSWPRWLGRSASVSAARRPVNPYVALVQKEIWLQSGVIGIAGLFVLTWTALWISVAVFSSRIDIDMLRLALSAGYDVGALLMMGASASAEERRLGTLPSQMLMPIAAWKQFAVKVLVLIVLAVLLGPLLIMTVQWLMPSGPVRQFQLPFSASFVGASIGGGLCVGLYVSSMSASALRAFIASLAALAVPFMGFGVVMWLSQLLAVAISHAVHWSGPTSVMEWQLLRLVPVLLAVGLGAMLLRLALHNHRAGLLDRRAVERQAGMVLLCVMLAALLQATLSTTVQVASFWRLDRRVPTVSELNAAYNNLRPPNR